MTSGEREPLLSAGPGKSKSEGVSSWVKSLSCWRCLALPLLGFLIFFAVRHFDRHVTAQVARSPNHRQVDTGVPRSSSRYFTANAGYAGRAGEDSSWTKLRMNPAIESQHAAPAPGSPARANAAVAVLPYDWADDDSVTDVKTANRISPPYPEVAAPTSLRTRGGPVREMASTDGMGNEDFIPMGSVLTAQCSLKLDISAYLCRGMLSTALSAEQTRIQAEIAKYLPPWVQSVDISYEGGSLLVQPTVRVGSMKEQVLFGSDAARRLRCTFESLMRAPKLLGATHLFSDYTAGYCAAKAGEARCMTAGQDEVTQCDSLADVLIANP